VRLFWWVLLATRNWDNIRVMSIPHFANRDLMAFRWRHAKQRVLKAYADFRVGATKSEMHCHKTSSSVLLTFDDYGTPEQVRGLLDVLGCYRVRGMFFVQGDWAEQFPELVRQIAEAGHIVGNHTYSHKNLLSLSDTEARREIARGPAGEWLRPPQGRFDARIRKIAAEAGYKLCYWTIDSDDWQGVPAADMQRKILAEVRPGAVILFHIHGRHTLELLPGLIEAIKQRGLEITIQDEPLWGRT
jgi:peptidoglycan/xylan/chitin deacetylase (PgdA/CDA1 family)